MVHLDFGNGRKITRTLNGNIATYVCTSEGKVLDVIPGIYEPETYLKRLHQGMMLSRWVKQGDKPAEPFLKTYHQQQTAALQDKQPAKILVSRGVSITGKERGIKRILSSSQEAGYYAKGLKARFDSRRPQSAKKTTTKNPPEEKALLKDTQINETVCSLKIHKYLAETNAVTPKQMTKWVYREVLHTDLDDPYLGLGDLLFGKYPFR